MDLLEKLDNLMAERGLNKSTLAQGSGVPYTTIDGLYKKGYENMKLSTLQKLCEYLGVTLDYLAKGSIEAAPPEHSQRPEESLPANEQELLAVYRTLTPAGQTIALNTLRTFAGSSTLRKRPDSMANAATVTPDTAANEA